MKTREELETEINIRDKLKEERELSDRSYAIKLIERIVFAMVSLILLGVLGAFIRMVIKN